ncbi:MAG: hypothetical protein LQ342_005050 [Letrouitia transgressa]|nr:MAG: hypothetical protein LQ342_005050 [Letrouitia transgressa]
MPLIIDSSSSFHSSSTSSPTLTSRKSIKMPSGNPFRLFRRRSRREDDSEQRSPYSTLQSAHESSPRRRSSASSKNLDPLAIHPSISPRSPYGNPLPTRQPEQPPPYTPVDLSSSTAATASIPAPSAVAAPNSAADDQYAFLSTFDTVFLIDDSLSMVRHWPETELALASIAPICTAHDKDGVDIHFLNNEDRPHFKNIKSAGAVQAVFRNVHPKGATPTGNRLNAIMKPYLRTCESKGPEAVKPLNIIVITDGMPTDDPESVIIAAARKLDQLEAPAWQVGIQFFQVGNEIGATEALKELDDGLAEMGNVRDMVDTVPFAAGQRLSADRILKVVLGAVNRRLDRRNVSLESIRRR